MPHTKPRRIQRRHLPSRCTTISRPSPPLYKCSPLPQAFIIPMRRRALEWEWEWGLWRLHHLIMRVLCPHHLLQVLKRCRACRATLLLLRELLELVPDMCASLRTNEHQALPRLHLHLPHLQHPNSLNRHRRHKHRHQHQHQSNKQHRKSKLMLQGWIVIPH